MGVMVLEARRPLKKKKRTIFTGQQDRDFLLDLVEKSDIQIICRYSGSSGSGTMSLLIMTSRLRYVSRSRVLILATCNNDLMSRKGVRGDEFP
ncbi:hypothetical protein NPIL_625231 [Nephila pilipes]|uniref:Uncharacterized protein n=1 Tax=Nephila pilipes TaxID=299642 RepID=A0A8X6TDJ2_NEPPI|nr:hypothetical protein NPIL_625231 [Nephila pilipes]